MRQWVVDQVTSDGAGSVPVILDPYRVAREEEILTATQTDHVVVAWDWFALRQAWERDGRHPSADRTAILVRNDVRSEHDLPWDIQQAASVSRIRVPADPDVRALLTTVADVDSDRIADAMATRPLPLAQLLAVLAGLPPTVVGHRVSRVQVALRLMRRSDSDQVRVLSRHALGPDSLIDQLLASPPEMTELSQLWDEWLADPDDPELTQLFETCRDEVTDLFLDGTMQPTVAATTVIHSWARLGTRESSPTERLQSLMSNQPPIPDAYAALEPWLPVASWWGAVRNELAQVNPPDTALRRAAWDTWATIDEAFIAWIRASYGTQLTRNWLNGPMGLHQVQPYLAHQIGNDRRALLLVFDGMSHTLWTQIRESAQLNVLHGGGTLAMLPSLTEISRQAIAAGKLPIEYPETLFTLKEEPSRWTVAWKSAGRSSAWLRVDGELDDLPAIPLGHHDAIGVVISATDKQMHAAKMMGDVGLHAGLRSWLQSGFLDRLLQSAADLGYDVWVTTDHGGIECLPEPGVNEGELVKRQGTRHRRYANRTLRDAALAEGIILDPVPGLPAEYGDCVLFAPGRVSWKNARISHGGLSMDEVIVPFAKVAAS